MELIFFTAAVFITGLALGSFLCVLVDRLPRGEQVLKGRSKCEHCHKVLSPIDLIPVISFLTLRGRCRYCHAKIPIHVFLTEIACGIMAAFLFVYASAANLPFPEFLLIFIILFSLMGIFMADLISGIIPDEFIVVIIAAAFVLALITNSNLLIQNFAAGFASFVLFLLLYLLTRGRGMGFGDVKFAAAIGFFLGFPNIIIGFYTSFLTAAAVSLILILAGRKKLRGDTIVFGPFLVIGTVTAYLFSDKIIKLFLG